MRFLRVIYNEGNIKKFTEELFELVALQKFSLISALEFIKTGMKKNGQEGTVQKAAEEIFEQLNKGNSFSYALRVNDVINFDNTYSAFISFSERNGNLAKTLGFLKERCIRKENSKNRIIEASIYPAFVVLLSVLALIAVLVYGKTFFNSAEFNFEYRKTVVRGLIYSFIFLAAFVVLVVSFLKRRIGNNRLYEAFSAVGFLVRAGVNLSNAVSIAVNILGEETPEGALFLRAGEKLLEGQDLRSAFLEERNYKVAKKVYTEIQEAFYFANQSGDSGEVFEKIADWLEAESLKKRTVCFKLIEPVLISGTGLFLLIFMGNILLPFLSGANLSI